MHILNIRNTCLLAGKILTGSSLSILKNVYMEIKNGIITKIKTVPKPICKEKLIDLSHLTLVPGPVDCHVHLALDGRDFRACLEKWHLPAKISLHIKKRLEENLKNGITCVRDGGDRNALVLSFNSSKNSKPHIMTSGAALRLKNMYGSFLGPGLEKHHIREAVSFIAGKGANQIKVLVSGIVSFKEYGRVGRLQFDLPALQTIVGAAQDYGLKVMAHASSDRAVQICVQAGVHSIEHGYFISRDSLKIMAEKGIYWIPTVVPVANQLKGSRAGAFTRHEQNVIDRTYKRHLEMIPVARELGVPVAVGTDAGATGVLHGEGFHEELQLYTEAGLSPHEIIKTATIAGAKLLNINTGLEIGKPARFIAVEGNPLKDLSVLKKPKYVAL